jgi:hypothetical protein
MIIVALLVVIILLMFKPIRQLVGLVFIFLVGCYFYGTKIDPAPATAVMAVEAPAPVAPAPAPAVTPVMPTERPFTSPPTPSFPTEAEMNRLTRGKSERDVMAAFGISLYRIRSVYRGASRSSESGGKDSEETARSANRRLRSIV